MMTTSSRDNWERLVAAVIKRDQIWQLCHQDSITTVDSDFTQRDISLRSVPSSPSRLLLTKDSVVQVLKCAVELQLADVIETHGGTMTHANLSAAVGCSPQVLRRIMRYLVHRRFFKQTTTTSITAQKPPTISYAQTPLSRQLMIEKGGGGMAALLLLESTPIMLAPWHRLSSRARENDGSPFEDEHGRDLWGYTHSDPAHSKLFDDGMSCIATASISAIVDQYPEAFVVQSNEMFHKPHDDVFINQNLVFL